MNAKEIGYILKIGIVGAIVAIAVNYFVEPAARTAVKLPH